MVGRLSWENIGERVRDSRTCEGLSQQDLADRVGLERSMISKLEKGMRRVDAMELTAIARALGYSVTHFLSPTPEVVSRRTSIAEVSKAGESAAARAMYRSDAELAQWLQDVRQLIDLGTLSPCPLMLYPHKVIDPGSARSAARWLRRHLDLGEAPSSRWPRSVSGPASFWRWFRFPRTVLPSWTPTLRSRSSIRIRSREDDAAAPPMNWDTWCWVMSTPMTLV